MKNKKQEWLLRSERLHHRRKRGRYHMEEGFEALHVHVSGVDRRPWMSDTVALSVNRRLVWVDWVHPRSVFHDKLLEGEERPEDIAIPLSMKRYRRPGSLYVQLCWPFGHNGTRDSAQVLADFTRAVMRRELSPSSYAQQLGYTHYTLQQWREDEEHWCLLPHAGVALLPDQSGG